MHNSSKDYPISDMIWCFLYTSWIFWMMCPHVPDGLTSKTNTHLSGSVLIFITICTISCPLLVQKKLSTLPRPSEISMKNWSLQMTPVLTPHLWHKAMHAERIKKIWVPFRIYQLTSTANPAKFTQFGRIGCATGVSKLALPLPSNFSCLFLTV